MQCSQSKGKLTGILELNAEPVGRPKGHDLQPPLLHPALIAEWPSSDLPPQRSSPGPPVEKPEGNKVENVEVKSIHTKNKIIDIFKA